MYLPHSPPTRVLQFSGKSENEAIASARNTFPDHNILRLETIQRREKHSIQVDGPSADAAASTAESMLPQGAENVSPTKVPQSAKAQICTIEAESEEEARQIFLSRKSDYEDWLFFRRLGPEEGPNTCKKVGCNHKSIKNSVLCRRHHFEMIKGKTCNFSEDDYRNTDISPEGGAIDIACIRPPSKSFFGFGVSKPGSYEVRWSRPFTASISYEMPVIFVMVRMRG
jgi:hypothetical protein